MATDLSIVSTCCLSETMPGERKHATMLISLSGVDASMSAVTVSVPLTSEHAPGVEVEIEAARDPIVVFGIETIGVANGRPNKDHMTRTPPGGRVLIGRPQTVRDPVVTHGL